ncbi:MAG: methylated-DNA--[protein]-cysteine S-methyltransferase [Clostridiales bacterium]|nr:methylated-DNA--[protein]-cysteine S-methyltransferase [Clostridiales bacterium]
MSEPLSFFTIASPIGTLYALTDSQALFYLGYRSDDARHYASRHRLTVKTAESPLTAPLRQELSAYFAGRLRRFTLPLQLLGTPFQLSVWQALSAIPYGRTASYKDIALAVKNPQASRAVGGANHHNPISIIIPCHRVIRADGQVGGYGGGLARKEYLLSLEHRLGPS